MIHAPKCALGRLTIRRCARQHCWYLLTALPVMSFPSGPVGCHLLNLWNFDLGTDCLLLYGSLCNLLDTLGRY